MPSRGTTCVLTFNLINILAESVNRSNALFWLTAKDRGPGLLEPFLCQLWTLLKGVGPQGAVAVNGSWALVDGLIERSVDDIVLD